MFTPYFFHSLSLTSQSASVVTLPTYTCRILKSVIVYSIEKPDDDIERERERVHSEACRESHNKNRAVIRDDSLIITAEAIATACYCIVCVLLHIIPLSLSYCARTLDGCIGNYKNWNQVDDDNQEHVRLAKRSEGGMEAEARRYANYIIIIMLILI